MTSTLGPDSRLQIVGIVLDSPLVEWHLVRSFVQSKKPILPQVVGIDTLVGELRRVTCSAAGTTTSTKPGDGATRATCGTGGTRSRDKPAAGHNPHRDARKPAASAASGHNGACAAWQRLQPPQQLR